MPSLWAWRSRLIWLLVALFAAIDSLPSEPLHPPLTVLAVLLAAVWTHSSQQQGFRRTMRRTQARIRELRNRADAFELAATTDPVTGLANRQAFYAALAETLGKPLEGLHGAPALLMIDLDRFKTINDTLGHHVGDRALRYVADTLRSTFRRSDIIARMGGDEFAVLAMEASGEDAAQLVERLREELSHLNERTKEQFQLSLSIGTTRYVGEDVTGLDDLLAKADAAMYGEKRGKRRAMVP